MKKGVVLPSSNPTHSCGFNRLPWYPPTSPLSRISVHILLASNFLLCVSFPDGFPRWSLFHPCAQKVKDEKSWGTHALSRLALNLPILSWLTLYVGEFWCTCPQSMLRGYLEVLKKFCHNNLKVLHNFCCFHCVDMCIDSAKTMVWNFP